MQLVYTLSIVSLIVKNAGTDVKLGVTTQDAFSDQSHQSYLANPVGHGVNVACNGPQCVNIVPRLRRRWFRSRDKIEFLTVPKRALRDRIRDWHQKRELNRLIYGSASGPHSRHNSFRASGSSPAREQSLITGSITPCKSGTCPGNCRVVCAGPVTNSDDTTSVIEATSKPSAIASPSVSSAAEVSDPLLTGNFKSDLASATTKPDLSTGTITSNVTTVT